MLKFTIGEESLPFIVDKNDCQESAFRPVIERGVSLIEDLMSRGDIDPKQNISKTVTSSSIQGMHPNNIISFLGERGSGKTSCLMSVLEVFKNRNGNDSKVEILDIIDPSFFDNEHNILEIFIGELYKLFAKAKKDYLCENNEKKEKLRNVQYEFKKANNAIRYLKEKYIEREIDELERLDRLSSGIDLTKILMNLIDILLDVLGKQKFVISIDDLDLNVNASYVMMEQIRKYLLIPNVVILLAAKFEQLEDGILLHMQENTGKCNVYSQQDLKKIATSFLDKFLPINQRIFMPDMDKFFGNDIMIITKDGEKNLGKVEYAVTSLIFEKTRFLFYNYEEEPSLIIPRNLRQLRMLVTALCRMDYPATTEIHNLNKNIFKNYFKTQWLQILDSDDQSFALELLEEENTGRINKLVLNKLAYSNKGLRKWIEINENLQGVDEISIQEKNQLTDILNESNLPDNLTIGDVLYVLDFIDKIEDSKEWHKMSFFIRTFYSMRLYELYDEMTSPESLGNNGIIIQEETPSTLPQLSQSDLAGLPEFFRLVKGSFFTMSGESMLPRSVSKKSRERFLIDGYALYNEINEIVSKFKGLKKDEQPSDILKLRLRVVEFFMLSVTRRVIIKNENSNWEKSDYWRTNTYTALFRNIGRTKNILFEVMSPFANLLYPRFTYSRFNTEIYDIAMGCEDSLINRLLNKERRYPSDSNRFHDLMSRICIRNMEVYERLLVFLESRKDSLRPDSQDSLGVLIDFYKLFAGMSDTKSQSFSLKTYDRQEGKDNFHTIVFTPMRIIGTVLEEFNSMRETGIEDTDPLKEEKVHLLSVFERILNPIDKIVSGTSVSLDEIDYLMPKDSTTMSVEARDFIIKSFRNENRIDSATLVARMGEYPLLDSSIMNRMFDTDLVKIYRESIVSYAQNALESIKNKISEVNDSIKLYESQLDKIEKDTANETSKLMILQKQKGNLEEHSYVCEETIKSLQYEEDRIEKQINHQNSELIQNKRQLEEKKSNIQKLEANVDADSKLLADKYETRIIFKDDDELMKFRKKKEILETEVNEMRNKITQEKSLANELAVKIENAEKDLKKLNEEKTRTQRRIASNINEQAQKIIDRDILDQQISMINKTISSLSAKQNSIKGEIMHLESTLAEIEISLKQERSKLGKLNRKLRAYV